MLKCCQLLITGEYSSLEGYLLPEIILLSKAIAEDQADVDRHQQRVMEIQSLDNID